MKKILRVLMLPTGKDVQQNQIYTNINDSVQTLAIAAFTELGDTFGNRAHHLYLIADEKVGDGDWFVNMPNRAVWQAKSSNYTFEYEAANYWKSINDGIGKWLFKVVATTDPSVGLPIIPQVFVEQYAHSNGEIKEVEYTDGVAATLINWKSVREDNKEFPTDGVLISKKQTLQEAGMEYLRTSKSEFFYISRECGTPNTLGQEILDAIEFGANWQKQNS